MQNTDLAMLVDQFMRRIHFGLQERAASFDTHAVGQSGGIVLMTLAEMEKPALSELTKRVARDKSQMTRTVRSLEAKGLVAREACPEDARITLVSLTPQGESVVNELMEAVAGVVDGILEPIASSDKQMLQSLLMRALHPSREA